MWPQEALAGWRVTREVAAGHETLRLCPCCGSARSEHLFNSCKHPGVKHVARRLRKGRYRLCHDCGVVFAASRPKPEYAKQYYDVLFKEGEIDDHPKAAIGRGADKHILSILQERDLLRPGMSVLHLRCDTGWLLLEVKALAPDAKLYGLDYFDGYIRLLREQGIKAERFDPGATTLPFNTNFDLILSNHQLTHAIDPVGMLRMLQEALSPNGAILFYNEIDHNIELDRHSPHRRNSEIVAFHKQLFTKATLEHLFASAGLDCEHLAHFKAKMMYLARPSTTTTPQSLSDVALLIRQKALIADFEKQNRRRRFRKRMRPLRKVLRWVILVPQVAFSRVFGLR